jgi:hypothetical protein
MTGNCAELTSELLAETNRLIALIEDVVASESADGRGGPGETLQIVQRYREELAKSIADGSAQDALRATNLLATTNRGLADAVWASDHEPVMAAGLQVTRSATIAAKCLRLAVGMAF